MARTKITNISGSPLPLIAPYNSYLRAGEAAIVSDSVATAISNLGGASAIKGLFNVDDVPSGNAADSIALGSGDLPADSVGTSQIAALAVGTDELAAGAVTLAKAKVFVSTEQTATGSAQDVAHGLGAVPSKVLICVTELPDAAAETGFDVAEGAHDGTDVKVTITATVKFKVLAWA